ncbi:MAG: alpha/beta hydrolase [Prevotellaceae bacterium]|jgi:acetyl esterase/lipase|nr:alpha/beta hydrolase [Prevotellaceae bacterium]
MKIIKTVFTLSVISALLFSSCGIFKKAKKVIDYSIFPQGTILSGETTEGSTFYMIREDSTQMSGICFVDNNRAVTEKVIFFADSTGATTFVRWSDSRLCKATVDKSLKELIVTIPGTSFWQVDSQSVRLSHFGSVLEKADYVERFKNPVFTDRVIQKDVQFGSALGYYSSKPSDYISKDDYKLWVSEMLSTSVQHNGFLFKKNMEQLPLKLDIYQPRNDTIKKRPIILFVHGGAFFFGDKENKLQQIITDYVVKRGFLVASINYRLGTSITPGSIERTIYRNVQDARAALRYLVYNKLRYRIDEDQIYLVGSSAGGIISLTTAFMDSNEVYSSTGSGLLNLKEDLGGLDGSGNKYTNSFKIAGVVSMWGGVTDLKILNNNIPTLLFHGTADDVVPNTEGLPFKDFMGNFVHRVLSSFGKIYGSEPVYNRLKSQNIPVQYIPFPGAGHDPCIESDNSVNHYMDTICLELGNFLYDNISKRYFPYRLTGSEMVSKSDPAPLYTIVNLTNEAVQWHVAGGFITHQTNKYIRVVWFDDQPTGTVSAYITNREGVSCVKEMEVRIEQNLLKAFAGVIGSTADNY